MRRLNLLTWHTHGNYSYYLSHELSEHDWLRVIGTNLNGPFWLAKYAAAHMRGAAAVIAGGMRTPFPLERFSELDPSTLQDPADVANAIRSVLLMPAASVVAELTVLPVQETSWR